MFLKTLTNTPTIGNLFVDDPNVAILSMGVKIATFWATYLMEYPCVYVNLSRRKNNKTDWTGSRPLSVFVLSSSMF